MTGYGVSSNVTSTVVTNNEDFENLLRFINLDFRLVGKYTYSSNNQDDVYNCHIGDINFTDEPSHILVPNIYDTFEISDSSIIGNDSIYMYKFNLINEFKDFKIEKTDTVSDVTVYINYKEDFLKNDIYEVALYGNKDKIIDKLKDYNYDYIDVSKFTQQSKLNIFLSNLGAYFTMFISTIAIVIVYFITYVILSKVYQSKKKDYTILRTLGITKKDMCHIVVYEVMAQTIIVSIIIYISLFIMGKTIDNDFFIIFNKITFLSTLIYFLVIWLFGYFIARRFNRRLFKFSVNQTFKGEVAKHD